MEGRRGKNDRRVGNSSVKNELFLEEVHVRLNNALGMHITKRVYADEAGWSNVEVRTDDKNMNKIDELEARRC